jgi:biopolymer transport protein TolR
MSISKQGRFTAAITRANVTPLADVTTTLIVVFLITMPAIMWNGIQVNSAEASSEEQVITPTVKAKDEITTIRVEPDRIILAGETVTLAELEGKLRARLAARDDKTVVIVPVDQCLYGQVVTVLDIAKASGAGALALLNELGGRP